MVLKKAITTQEMRREFCVLVANQVSCICTPVKLFSLMAAQNTASQMLSNMQNNIFQKNLSNLLHNVF